MRPNVRRQRLLFWALFTPLLISSSGISDCEVTGDTRLTSLEIEVLGVDLIVFDPMLRVYDVPIPQGATQATVRAVPMDPLARVTWYVPDGAGMLASGNLVAGGGEVTVDLPPDGYALYIGVFPPGGAINTYIVNMNYVCPPEVCDGIDNDCDGDIDNGIVCECFGDADCDDGTDCTSDTCDPVMDMCTHTPVGDGTACDAGGVPGTCIGGTCELSTFPCTEQGIRDAIAIGGGPHRFDCNGPTVVQTQAEIVIDNDVVLDGEGRLSIRRGPDPATIARRAMAVDFGVVAELIDMTISGSGGELPVDGRGGAMFNEGTLTLRNSRVVDTVITDGCRGGGIHNTGNLWLIGSSVEETSCTDGLGGGIFNAGLAVIEDSDIINTGHLGLGGGIYNTGDVSLVDSSIDLNFASVAGGIYSFGSLTATRITVSWNGDDTDGGSGVGIFSDGSALIDRSIVSYNFSNFRQGTAPALELHGTAVVVNTTVSMNEGGLLGSGTMDLIGSTLIIEQGSSFTTDRGIEFDGELRARQTIFVDTSGQPAPPLCATLIVSEGYNIESPGDTCGFTDPTDQVNVTAAELNLGPLADNGGTTQTHALLPGSVAIDHVPAPMCVDENGDPLTTDQRGVDRPQGTMCDVGAFEVQP